MFNNGALKNANFQVTHPEFGPIFNTDRLDSLGIPVDAKEVRRETTSWFQRVIKSKNNFNYMRSMLAGSLYSWTSTQDALREQNIELNVTHAPAVRLFILVMIARIFCWAAGSSSHANSFEYRVFCLREREPTISPERMVIFWIGEQILRLAHGEKTVKSSSLVDDDVLKKCAKMAVQVINGVDEAHRLSTNQDVEYVDNSGMNQVRTKKVVRRAVVVNALFDRLVWQLVQKMTKQAPERIRGMMLMFISVDDFSVEPDEGKIGRYSLHEGSTDTASIYGTDAETAPVATTEAGMVSLNGGNSHFRIPCRVDTHIKKDNGVHLQDQINNVLSVVFTWCGLFFFVFAICGDHARSNRSQLEAVDAYLSFPDKFRTSGNSKDVSLALKELEKNVREEHILGETIFIQGDSNTIKQHWHTIGYDKLVWFIVEKYILPSHPRQTLDWQRIDWVKFTSLSLISTSTLIQFNTFFKLNQHHLADSLTMHSKLRKPYDARRLDQTVLGSVYKSVDDLLIELHQESPTKTTYQLIKEASMDLAGTYMKGKKSEWTADVTDSMGGISKDKIALLSIPQINTILIKVGLPIGVSLASLSSRGNKELALCKMIETAGEVRSGPLESARALLYFHATRNVMAIIAFMVCSPHLVKAFMASICTATAQYPRYIQLERTPEVLDLIEKMKKEDAAEEAKKSGEEAKKAEEETAAKEEEKEAAEAKMTLAQRVQNRLTERKKNSKYWKKEDDEEEDGPEDIEEDEAAPPRRTKEEDQRVRDPPPGSAEIHGQLMVWLFIVVGAFIIIGQGNVCRFLKLRDWLNNSHGKMNVRRFSSFIRCLDFIQCIINDRFGNKPIPWDSLIGAVPGLQRPTARMLLGFRGLLRVGRQLETIFSKFLLRRRFATVDGLEKAEAACVEMIKEHLIHNPTLKSNDVKGHYFSRYQVVEGIGGLLVLMRRLVENNLSLNAKVVDRLSSPVRSKIGLKHNSGLEAMIGHIRNECPSGNITGRNLRFAWRRFINIRMKRSFRLGSCGRRDYDQLAKDIELFHKLEIRAEKMAVDDTVEMMLLTMEKMKVTEEDEFEQMDSSAMMMGMYTEIQQLVVVE